MRRGRSGHHLWAAGCVLVLYLLSLGVRWQGVSIIPWVVSLSTFFAFTYSGWWVPFLILLILGELFSGLAPGVVSLSVTLPYILQRFGRTFGLTHWQLWVYILGTIALQLLIFIFGQLFNIVGLAWPEPEFLMTFWPLRRVALQLLVTGGIVGIMVGVWRELKPAHEH